MQVQVYRDIVPNKLSRSLWTGLVVLDRVCVETAFALNQLFPIYHLRVAGEPALWSSSKKGLSLSPGPRECAEAVLRDRALYLPTLSHLLIVNILLFLSLSLPLPLDGQASPNLGEAGKNRHTSARR
jgi:hypothetical protein